MSRQQQDQAKQQQHGSGEPGDSAPPQSQHGQDSLQKGHGAAGGTQHEDSAASPQAPSNARFSGGQGAGTDQRTSESGGAREEPDESSIVGNLGGAYAKRP
jgi:hypothetical protein